ncbi:MAG TPA: glycosyltransferase family 87 protein, partial [Thermoanaerobaculia bacterium]
MTRTRRVSILAAIYGVPALLLVVVARGVVPPIIRDAYLGRSLPALNAVFRRRIPHPVEHYLDLWRFAWQALLLAWACHLVVVLTVLAADKWLGVGRSPEARRRSTTLDRRLIAFALAFLALTVLSGPRQDYVAYLEEWGAVLAGTDPWWIHERFGFPLNAYGPLFNLLALPVRLNPMAPKLLFALAYCLFVVLFLKREMARPGPPGFPTSALFAWLLGPFFWVEIAYFGHFDILVAIACVAALAFLVRGREWLSGASLAAGFLLKLIPVVIVPFFAIDAGGRRVRLRVLAGAVIPIVAGYAASYAIWGPSTFRPFEFAYRRGSNLLSIFWYLRGGASPLRWFTDRPDLDAWSTPCLAVAGLLVFLACQWRRADPATSALVAVLTTLLFYQVGFVQYQMILFLLMAPWLVRHGPALAQRRGLAASVVGYFGWLTLFDLLYCYAGGILPDRGPGPWAWLGDRAALPTFLLGIALLINLLRLREGSIPG